MNLNKETFEAWLFSQPRNRVIETACTTRCFICSFLKETARVTTPVVTWDRWWGPFLPSQPLPDWALQLIDRDWIKDTCPSMMDSGLTVGQMQDRWRKLWPEPKDTNDTQTKTHSDQTVAA